MNLRRWAAAALALPLSALAASAHAATQDAASGLATSVAQVRAYFYDPVDRTVTLRSLGSGVMLDGGRLVTNAHVVLDDDGKLADGLLLCRTSDWHAAPTCDLAARAVSVDADADLALLEPVGPAAWTSGAAWSGRAPELGEKVRAVGFPANGGGTVTVTEGTVGGADADSGWLKVDANLDAGNSGGGAFDASGALVGIPSAVATGYSTLGYVIPEKLVKAFLASPASLVDGAGGAAGAEAFARYAKEWSAKAAGASIDDPRFRLRGFARFGYRIADLSFTQDQASTRYRLADAGGQAVVTFLGASGGGSARAPASEAARLLAERKKGCAAYAEGVLPVGGGKAPTALCVGKPTDADAVLVFVQLREDLAAVLTGDRGTPAGRQALARGIKMVAAAGIKDPSAPWRYVQVGALSAPIPSGFEYWQRFSSAGTLTRELAGYPSGQAVGASVAQWKASDSTARSKLADLISGTAKGFRDEGYDVTWAGVGRAGTGGTAMRFSWRDAEAGTTSHMAAFAWKDADGDARFASVTFSSKNGAAALKAANAFAASATVDGAFPWALDGVAYGANYAGTGAAK